MLICTVSTYRHVPRALVMAKSIKQTMPNARVVLCLLEKTLDDHLPHHPYLDAVVLAKDLGKQNFERFIFKYEVNESSFAMKSVLLDWVLAMYKDEEKFIYLDSDVKVYSPLTEVDVLLNTCSIVLTPHILSAHEKEINPITEENMHMSIEWRELGAIKTGLYNAGFVAIRRDAAAHSFLRWWMERTEYYCYCDYEKGINYDQKWLDLVPGLFGAHILRNPGYNMAFWNLSERKLQQTDKGLYMVNSVPLRFFHYSGVGGMLNMMIKRCYPQVEDSLQLYTLLNEYTRETELMNENHYKEMPWSYGFFTNGDKIKSKSRRRYREYQHLFNHQYEQLFQLSNSAFDKKKIDKKRKLKLHVIHK